MDASGERSSRVSFAVDRASDSRLNGIPRGRVAVAAGAEERISNRAHAGFSRPLEARDRAALVERFVILRDRSLDLSMGSSMIGSFFSGDAFESQTWDEEGDDLNIIES